MKIAIPYDNGQVFAHFGKAAQFKFYVIDEFEILSCEVVDTAATGHGALAQLLTEKNVNAVICGGIGFGAVSALQEAGIQIMGGASGEADQQVLDFLNGKIHFSAPGAGDSGRCKSHPGEEVEGAEPECDGNINACGHGCGSPF